MLLLRSVMGRPRDASRRDAEEQLFYLKFYFNSPAFVCLARYSFQCVLGKNKCPCALRQAIDLPIDISDTNFSC